MENSPPPPQLAWERRELTTQEKIYRFVRWARVWGADEAVLGSHLHGVLLAAAYTEEESLDLLHDVGIVWRPHSEAERLVRIAAGMIANGLESTKVRWAIEWLASNEA
jgi:hypothetical protein